MNYDNFGHIRHTASIRHAKSPVFMRLLADWRSWRIFSFFACNNSSAVPPLPDLIVDQQDT
jgi:hypothetical protein